MTSLFGHPELVEGSVPPVAVDLRATVPSSGGADNLLSGWPKATGGSLKIFSMAILVPVLTACSVTPEKIAQIKPAMNAGQVEAILGRPTRIEQSETTGLKGEVDYYPASRGEGRVVYLNQAVFKAEFIPNAKKS